MTSAQMRLKLFLVIANLLLALLIAGTVTLQTVHDHARVEEKAFQSSENLVSVLAKQTRQILAPIDLAMASIATAVLAADVDGEELAEILREHQALTLGNHGYFVLDAGGRLLATSLPAVAEAPHLSDLPEYQTHRDDPATGLALFSRQTRIDGEKGSWIVTVSRRISDGRGNFTGVVVAVMPMDYLRGLYDIPWLGDVGSVSLFNAARVMVARHPFVAEHVGRHFGDETWMRRYVDTATKGRLLASTQADGLRRYSTFEWIGDSDAVVVVGLDERRAFANWRQRLIFAVVMSGVAIALLVGGSVGLYTYFRRRTEWEEERSRRLRLIASESEALLACQEEAGHDEERILRRVTEAARELIGAHQAATSLVDDDFAAAVNAISLSNHSRENGGCGVCGDSGLQRQVCENNKPLCLTQAQLEQHPLWQGAGKAGKHRFLHGWLGVPLIASDGANLGLIQLSDKYWGEFNADDVNELVQLASIASAILESGRASRAREEALTTANAARQEVETIFTSISDAVYAVDSEWRFLHLNPRAEALLGRSRWELVGQSLWEAFPAARGSLLDSELHRARDKRVTVDFEFLYPPLASWFSVRAYPNGDGLTVYFQDITERVEAEERLRQVQKLDAIGQLTGGVAHDFNNLLTVIMGSSESLLATLDKGAVAARDQVKVILQASERGASLTHRLLAFARRQPLNPRLIDINRLMADSEEMLSRLLTEDIQIELVRGSGLWKAVVDPNELQNAILNLAINARDAMPDGGKLTIETANIAVDADYAAIHGITAGQFVMVAVSDTGEGIAPGTLARVFEPFFTTKGVGKGSGLGLSMVYGFARQSGGHARIYSEPGEGTTVRLYLPRENGNQDIPLPVAKRTRERYQGTESVLVVEDDDLVRQHTLNSLGILGYRATACADGPAALALFNAGRRFDLLLTDVVLPGGMSGRQLADVVAARVPEIKVLYMSGYTENAIVHHGRLDRGVHLLGKPFRLEDLGRKVREVLDSPVR